MVRRYRSHGSGEIDRTKFKKIGENIIFENGVLAFHAENIELGNNIYIGHYTILKGYYKNVFIIDDNTWIGQGCFLHSGGGLRIGKDVGIGPGVKIITSYHENDSMSLPILHSNIGYSEVIIEDECDIGVGAIILPGVTIGKGSQVGAGAVVTKLIEPYSIVAGVPAKLLRFRKK